MHKYHCRLVLALGLGLAFGCNSEEAASNAPPPVSSSPVAKPSQPPGAAPAVTPAAPTTADTKAPAASKDEGKKTDAPSLEGPKTNAAAEKLTDEELAEVKKLPADEQAIALKQVSCPVSDEHLGGMGVPIKAEIEGRTFFLCCKNCQAEVKKDPKGVLAKLDKKP